MIKRFRVFLVSIVSAFALFAPAILAPALVNAAAPPSIQNGLNCGSNLQFTDNTSNCTPTGGNPTTTVNRIVTLIINIFSVVVGIIAVIMIIVGGVRFILSGGDSAATTSARNTVLYAIVGLIVVFLAQIIVHYVLQRIQNT